MERSEINNNHQVIEGTEIGHQFEKENPDLNLENIKQENESNGHKIIIVNENQDQIPHTEEVKEQEKKKEIPKDFFIKKSALNDEFLNWDIDEIETSQI